ncbi:MAG: hypothetical protein RLZZ618_1971 [Pseudomonadota bacterium]|jgi:hypothetical protein
MGNSVNTTVSTGGVAPPGVIKSDCDELKEDVEKADAQVQRDIKKGSANKKTEKRKLDAHKASTVTSSKSSCGGTVQKQKAYSSLSRLPKSAQKNYAQGTKGKKSNMCPKANGKPFKHSPDNFRSSCNHTEGRLIEDLFKKQGSGGTVPSGCELTMKIKWRQRTAVKTAKGNIKGYKSRPAREGPCAQCEKVICHAKKCGLKIFLCVTKKDKQEKQEPDCV